MLNRLLSAGAAEIATGASQGGWTAAFARYQQNRADGAVPLAALAGASEPTQRLLQKALDVDDAQIDETVDRVLGQASEGILRGVDRMSVGTIRFLVWSAEKSLSQGKSEDAAAILAQALDDFAPDLDPEGRFSALRERLLAVPREGDLSATLAAVAEILDDAKESRQ